ncbi:hypothetical protein JCM5350_004195 [Sporobolomyces pararoseus]
MSNAYLLGTPLPSTSRQRERSAAPSPYTPFQSKSSRVDQTPTERSSTPTFQSTPSSSSLPPRPASPTLSTTSTSTFSRNSKPSQSQIVPPSQDELRQQAQQAVQKTRILSDPSLSSCFRKDLDEELWNLFVGP